MEGAVLYCAPCWQSYTPKSAEHTLVQLVKHRLHFSAQYFTPRLVSGFSTSHFQSAVIQWRV